MGWGKALEALFKIVGPIIAFFVTIRKSKNAGRDKAKLEIAENELEFRHEFEKDGEEWEDRGGLGVIVSDRVQKSDLRSKD
jgi:hypothetical protein